MWRHFTVYHITAFKRNNNNNILFHTSFRWCCCKLKERNCLWVSCCFLKPVVLLIFAVLCESFAAACWLWFGCRWQSAFVVAGPGRRKEELLGRLPAWSSAVLLQPGGELHWHELLLQLWCWHRHMVQTAHTWLLLFTSWTLFCIL